MSVLVGKLGGKFGLAAVAWFISAGVVPYFLGLHPLQAWWYWAPQLVLIVLWVRTA